MCESWIDRVPSNLARAHTLTARVLEQLQDLDSTLSFLDWLTDKKEQRKYANECAEDNSLVGKAEAIMPLCAQALADLKDAYEKADEAVESVEELFGVANSDVFHFRDYFDWSVHRLVADLGFMSFLHFLGAVDDNDDIDDDSPLDLESRDVVPLDLVSRDDLMVYLQSACDGRLREVVKAMELPSWEEHSRLSAALTQELFRAWRLSPKGVDPEEPHKNVGPVVQRKLSPSERGVIELIRLAGRRMTTKEILAALEKKDGAASEGTTKTTLAGLVRRGLLTNRQDVTPRGYDLPGWNDC